MVLLRLVLLTTVINTYNHVGSSQTAERVTFPKLCKTSVQKLVHSEFACGWWFQSTCDRYYLESETTNSCCDGYQEILSSDRCTAVCDVDCKNGGVCVGGNCTCQLGFQPPNCDDIDECKMKPCPDGFTCNNNLGSYVCSPVPEDRCGAMKCSEHGKCNDTGHTVSCECLRGYTGDGFHCHKILCNDLLSPVNGTVTFSDKLNNEPHPYGTVATFSCSSPFTLMGSRTLHCEHSGSWNSQAPRCLVGCSQNCAMNASCIQIGRKPHCVCNEGFNGNGLTCTEIECPEIEVPENGYVEHSDGNKTKDQVHFACNHGYIIKGDKTRTCMSEQGSNIGKWSGATPSCTDPCESKKCPNNAVCVVNSTETNCLCIEGHKQSGDGSCQSVDCGTVPVVAHGQNQSYQNSTFGSVATYSCDMGYYIESSSSLICTGNGSWVGVPPKCLEIPCSIAGRLNLTDGQVNQVDDFNDLPGVKYSCNSGFLLEGQEEVFCLQDGNWTAGTPICKEIRCANTSTIRNGALRVTGGDPGSHGTISCDKPYTLSGSPSIECDESGAWNYTTPFCSPFNGSWDCSLPGRFTSPPNGLSFNCTHDKDQRKCIGICTGNQTYEPHDFGLYQCVKATPSHDWMVHHDKRSRFVNFGRCVEPSYPLVTRSVDGLVAEINTTLHEAELLSCIHQFVNTTCVSDCMVADIRLQLIKSRRRSLKQLFEVSFTLSEQFKDRNQLDKNTVQNQWTRVDGELRKVIDNLLKSLKSEKWMCSESVNLTWLNQEAAVGSMELDCKAGYSLHSQYCYRCPEGTYSVGEEGRCEPCAIGFYQPSTGQTNCLPCPIGTTTEREGSGDIGQCKGFVDCNCGQNDCVLEEGGFRCVCGVGFKQDGPQICSDIDECEKDVCPGHSQCFNTAGSYVCLCREGFHGEDCQDINECHLDVCPDGYLCLNTPGSYTCSKI